MVTPVNRFTYVVGSSVGEEEVAAEYDRCGARWLSLEGGSVPVITFFILVVKYIFYFYFFEIRSMYREASMATKAALLSR